jgi:excisionase family DNA binding protein
MASNEACADAAAGKVGAEKMTGIPFRERISCTVAEACDATGIGRTKLYELIRLKQVSAKKIGRRTVILIPTLLAEIEGRRTGP